MLRDRLGVSERWACRVVGQHRSTQRREPVRAADDAALRAELRKFSKDRPRWGYRRAHHRLRGLGWEVSPVGALFCVLHGPTRGRPCAAAGIRNQLRSAAVAAGVRRRFAPHQLRHAHAVEMSREGVPPVVIQRPTRRPLDHLRLPARHRQNRDRPHRPRTTCADDPRHSRSQTHALSLRATRSRERAPGAGRAGASRPQGRQRDCEERAGALRERDRADPVGLSGLGGGVGAVGCRSVACCVPSGVRQERADDALVRGCDGGPCAARGWVAVLHERREQ